MSNKCDKSAALYQFQFFPKKFFLQNDQRKIMMLDRVGYRKLNPAFRYVFMQKTFESVICFWGDVSYEYTHSQI